MAIIIALTFTQYGVTWDEPVQNQYGAAIVTYYRLLFHGHYVLPFSNAPSLNLNLYGGLFDTLAAPFNLFHHHLYEGRHLLNAIFGLVGVVGCWKVARFVGGPKVGFFAALLLLITPRYYGSMFNNPKDIPFAVAYIWSLYYLLAFARNLPNVNRRINWKLSIAIGAALATRVGGLILIAYLGLIVVLFVITHIKRVGFSEKALPQYFAILRSCMWITAVAWMMMLVFWPWAQANPFVRPFQALSRFSYFADWQGLVLFRGVLIKSTQLPRIYILQWLAITLPELFLLGLFLALLYGAWHLFSSQRQNRDDLRNASIVIFASLFPLVYVIAKKSILYNGERHVMFIVPPLACLAAWGTIGMVSKLRPAPKKVVALCAFAYLVFQVHIMVMLHPDQYVYFNQFVGGLKGADGNYDTDYWGNSLREAVRDLSLYLNSSSAPDPARQYKIYLKYIDKACVTYYFPRNFSLTFDPADADYFIANTSIGTDKQLDGTVILKVEKMGVPLAVVKELPAAKVHRARGVSAALGITLMKKSEDVFARISDKYLHWVGAWMDAA